MLHMLPRMSCAANTGVQLQNSSITVRAVTYHMGRNEHLRNLAYFTRDSYFLIICFLFIRNYCVCE